MPLVQWHGATITLLAPNASEVCLFCWVVKQRQHRTSPMAKAYWSYTPIMQRKCECELQLREKCKCWCWSDSKQASGKLLGSKQQARKPEERFDPRQDGKGYDLEECSLVVWIRNDALMLWCSDALMRKCVECVDGRWLTGRNRDDKVEVWSAPAAKRDWDSLQLNHTNPYPYPYPYQLLPSTYCHSNP